MLRRLTAPLLALALASSACGATVYPSSTAPAAHAARRFELRVVRADTGERIPSWDGGLVPVGAERLDLDDAVLAASLVRDPERDGTALSVTFRLEARPRLDSFTSAHVGERVAFVVAGRAAATLTIKDAIVGDALLLTAMNDADVLEMKRRLIGD